MLSRVVPLEYLKERDLAFWLPPGGRDNEIWADTWVILADLESADAAPVLALLHDADVGAYIASPSGLRGATARTVQLYVDREQHNKAVDLLMLFLRGKSPRPIRVKAATQPRPKRVKRSRSAALRTVVLMLKVAAIAGLLALGMLLAYYRGPSLFPTVQHGHHPAPETMGPCQSALSCSTSPEPSFA